MHRAVMADSRAGAPSSDVSLRLSSQLRDRKVLVVVLQPLISSLGRWKLRNMGKSCSRQAASELTCCMKGEPTGQLSMPVMFMSRGVAAAADVERVKGEEKSSMARLALDSSIEMTWLNVSTVIGARLVGTSCRCRGLVLKSSLSVSCAPSSSSSVSW